MSRAHADRRRGGRRGADIESDDDVGSDEEEQAQARVQQDKRAAADSLQRALRTAGHCEETGAHTAQQLRRQEDQIDRMQRKNNDMREDLHVSKKLVKSIGSFFHGMFGRDPNRASRAASSPPEPQPDAAAAGGAAARRAPPPLHRAASRGSAAAPADAEADADAEVDANLDLLLAATSRMKQQSIATGQTIQRQNEKLDRLAEDTEHNRGELRQLNRKIQALT